jgi:hypothetical protein
MAGLDSLLTTRNDPAVEGGRQVYVRLAAAALLGAAACTRGASPARERSANADVPAALIVVEGLDEEGGMIGRGRLSDTALVAFFRDHVIFADARVILEYLAPNSRMDVVEGKLRLDGGETGIPVELRDSVSFVPVRPVADRFGALARIEESPGRMVTLWRTDVLCRYALDAERGADVFLEAAEQGLLRRCRPPIDAEVRRWSSALPNERWAASVTLRQPLDSANAAALLEQYHAMPYVAYGGVAGHHLIVRAPPDSASMHVLTRLSAAGIEALERALCGLPGAVDHRRGAVIRRHPRGDAFRGERHMLASALAARRELPRLRAGAAIVHGVDVIAAVAELRRLAADARVHQFEPATRVDNAWVVPGADLRPVEGRRIPSEVAALDSAALFARLQAEAARAAAECPSAQRR